MTAWLTRSSSLEIFLKSIIFNSIVKQKTPLHGGFKCLPRALAAEVGAQLVVHLNSWCQHILWSVVFKDSRCRRRWDLFRVSWYLVNFPSTRWSLYLSLAFCVDHLASFQQRDGYSNVLVGVNIFWDLLFSKVVGVNIYWDLLFSKLWRCWAGGKGLTTDGFQDSHSIQLVASLKKLRPRLTVEPFRHLRSYIA